jgi:hypothetical protein
MRHHAVERRRVRVGNNTIHLNETSAHLRLLRQSASYLSQVSTEIILADIALNLSGMNNRYPQHLKRTKKEKDEVRGTNSAPRVGTDPVCSSIVGETPGRVEQRLGRNGTRRRRWRHD